METPIIRPQTFKALIEFVKCWNLESVAYNTSLIINGHRAVIMNGMEILSSMEIPLEDTDHNENNATNTSFLELETAYSSNLNEISSTDPEETTIFENNDIEWNIGNEEILGNPEVLPDPSANENSETTLETDDLTREQSAIMTRILKDLTDEKLNTPFRANPLLTFSWKDKVNEIIHRLNREIRGSQREKQVHTLEACYYLGTILNEFQNNPKVSKEIRQLLKNSLGTYKMYNFWKGANRIHQVLRPEELSRLYQTQFITLSNMNRLSTENFDRLIELRTNGVSS